MATKIFEGFSISHAAILNGTTGLQETFGDIYGVRSGSVEPDTDSYDNTGDDYVMSTWYWLNYATITVQAGYVPFDLLALINGTVVTSSGTAPNDVYSIPMWDTNYGQQPPRPMLIRVPARDSDGVSRNLDFIFYRVQFEPFGFDGPSYKDGLLLNYTGRAVISTKDEKGQTLATPSVGRIVSTKG